jgi:hypothetical protein
MKLDETMAMAYARKYLEHTIIGLEDPLHQRLVKLAGLDFPPEQRRHFRRVIRTWLDKIQGCKFTCHPETKGIETSASEAVRKLEAMPNAGLHRCRACFETRPPGALSMR